MSLRPKYVDEPKRLPVSWVTHSWMPRILPGSFRNQPLGSGDQTGSDNTLEKHPPAELKPRRRIKEAKRQILDASKFTISHYICSAKNKAFMKNSMKTCCDSSRFG